MKKLFFVLMAMAVLAGCGMKKTYKVTLVELMASGCVHCEKVKPLVDELRKEYKDRVNFLIYDVTTKEGSEKAGLYGLKGTPTFIFLDEKGSEYFRLEQIIQKDVMEALLNSQLNSIEKKK
jgi:thiol-disulfide isomerase/thioredoxin